MIKSSALLTNQAEACWKSTLELLIIQAQAIGPQDKHIMYDDCSSPRKPEPLKSAVHISDSNMQLQACGGY